MLCAFGLIATLFFPVTCMHPPTHYPEKDTEQNESDFSEKEQSVSDFKNDMFLNHEGNPAGVPKSYNWYNKPVVVRGANIPIKGERIYPESSSSAIADVDWTHINSWGQVYADKEHPTPDKTFPNVRVHLKDIDVYLLSKKTNSWTRIDRLQNVYGDLYTEDFVDNIKKSTEKRIEPDGGISVTAGSGWTFHFYGNRTQIPDPNDIKGLFVVCKGRLTGGQANQDPRYLLSVGADYWKNKSAKWAPNYENNVSVGTGRMKYVTRNWEYYTLHTFSQTEVQDIIFPKIL